MSVLSCCMQHDANSRVFEISVTQHRTAEDTIAAKDREVVSLQSRIRANASTDETGGPIGMELRRQIGELNKELQ